MPTRQDTGTAPMKKQRLLWVIAGTLGFGTCGQPSFAVNADLPPLEPPATAPRGAERAESGAVLPDLSPLAEAAGPRLPPGAGSYHEATAITTGTPLSPVVHTDR